MDLGTLILAVNEHAGHDGGWWPFFPIFWILFFVGLFWLLKRRGFAHHCRISGETVLAERFARGEITEQEYGERLQILRQRRR